MRYSNHIKSAVGPLSQHKQLSHDSLITNDFGQLCPCLAMPLLPRDKFDIHASVFSRVSPMIFPTYGNCDIVTNFHSVQYSQIWRDFDVFVTGEKYRGSTNLRFPVVTSDNLYSLYLTDVMSYEGDASESSYDLKVVGTSQGITYRYLTLFGRYVRKILVGLGYPFMSYIDQRPDIPKRYFSALPLLSLFKIYHDFYESRQYSQTSNFAELLREVYNGVAGTYTSNETLQDGTLVLALRSLVTFFLQFKLLFPSDYFTSAQAYPSMVGGSRPIVISGNTNASAIQGQPFFQPYTLSQETFDTDYAQSAQSDGSIRQSNPMHRLLDNFENLIRRYNLVGSREVDRIRALFGIRPTVQRNQYSVFHGGFSSDLRIQDITSTSVEPSADNYLGSYAGKGISSDGTRFHIESDDFGYLIGLSFLRVRPLYSPGLDREVLKIYPMSFYNPDFDHGYSMAVATGELFSEQSGNIGNQGLSPLFQTFGFQNAYDEYRQRVSRINGDFTDNDLLPFSFARVNLTASMVAQSDNLIYQRGPRDLIDSDDPNSMYNEFQRIFVDGSGRDHFYMYYGFEINALRPVRTSSASFDLGVGDISTNNNPVI